MKFRVWFWFCNYTSLKISDTSISVQIRETCTSRRAHNRFVIYICSRKPKSVLKWILIACIIALTKKKRFEIQTANKVFLNKNEITFDIYKSLCFLVFKAKHKSWSARLVFVFALRWFIITLFYSNYFYFPGLMFSFSILFSISWFFQHFVFLYLDLLQWKNTISFLQLP